MSEDAFTIRLRRLRDEAANNFTRSLDFLEHPINPDEILNPPNTLEEHPTLRQLLARELLQLESENRVSFNQLVRQQIEEAARAGTMSIRGQTTHARDGTLITLLALTVRQSTSTCQGRHAPFYVLSLFRARGVRSPHDHGLGIDVLRYNGYSFRGPTRESFNGTLMLVRNLPTGTFELGLPRVPRENWHDYDRYQNFRIGREYLFRQDRETPEFSPRFRNRGILGSRRASATWAGQNEFLMPDSEIRRSPSRRGFRQDLEYFQNPENAEQFRRAEAESEGTIRLIFPDEPNHVHITVDIDDAWTRVLNERRENRRNRTNAR